MISITWDESSEQWYHHEIDEQIVWGAANQPLPYFPGKNGQLNITLLRKDSNKVGPIIGILTSSRRYLPFVGNLENFVRLSVHVHKRGGLAVIFSAKDLSSSSIQGYTFDWKALKWKQVTIPPPNFIYNRIPYPEHESTLEFCRLLEWIDKFSIPYFNRCFFSKWDTYLILNDNPILQKFLPETRLIRSKRQLRNFIYEHKHIIIKPSSSSKGEGIFTIKLNQNHGLLYQSNAGSIYTDSDQIWKIIQKKNRFIMQPFVKRKKYQLRPFDYRILVQKQYETWKVTGYGLRIAGSNKITTHIPSGGSLLPASTFPIETDLSNIIASEIGNSLDQAMGPVGEFSIDLGIDTSERYWIFEVNSKPMVFDEKEIQIEALDCWYRQILEMTGFSHPDINHLHPTNNNEKGGRRMTEKGSQYEGRDRSHMDIDRMINEGMAGGTVTGRYDHEQIEEATPIHEEEPPVEYTDRKNSNKKH